MNRYAAVSGISQWLLAHWKLWGIPTIAASLGAVIKSWYALRKAKAEAHIAERQLAVVEQEESRKRAEKRLEALGERIRQWAEGQKVGNPRQQMVEFHRDDLARVLGSDGEYLGDVLKYLQKTGHARKSVFGNPKFWHIG